MTEEEYEKEINPFIHVCRCNTLNGNLEKEYKSLTLPTFQSSDIEQKLSCPLFINLGQDYKAGEGIFIIGQETHGWGGKTETIGNNLSTFKSANNKEKTLMEAQSEWLLMHYQYFTNSDFHNAVKAITGIAKGEDFLNSQFVWDNLIAMDCNKSSYRSLARKDRDEILKYSAAKLNKELTIAKPKMAIFLIGSYGDTEIWKIFKLLKKEDISEVMPNLNTFELTLNDEHNQEIKIKCFATCHPSYKGWGNKEDVIRKLAEEVKGNNPKQ
jgi:hypothetical protein